MATYQIITLRTIGQEDGSFDVFGVFWLVTPPGTAQPLPKFTSAFLGVSTDDLASLQAGDIIEMLFSSRDAVSFFATFVDTGGKILTLPALAPSATDIAQQQQENPGAPLTQVTPTGDDAAVSFPPGTSQDVVDQVLLSYFNELQVRLNKKTTPLPSAVGRVFDGNVWGSISLGPLPPQQILNLANSSAQTPGG